MKRKFITLSKIVGLTAFYMLVLVAATFLTMSLLIKGDEIKTPNLTGKSLNEAYKIASKTGVFLKKKVVNYDPNYKPLTIVNQNPQPGTRIKEKSIVKIYVTSELVEVIVPDLTNYTLKQAEKILEKNDLKKRYVSFMEADSIPVDLVISQSYPAGSKISRGSGVDILVCSGKKQKSYIMPLIIGMKAEKALILLESNGFKISKITEVPYPQLEPGIIINQFPHSGHKIDSKNLISAEVSK